MSILVDYNQIALGALMVSLKRGEELNDSLVRHIVLNNIRYYRERFSDKYGDEFVIACDNKQYWRGLAHVDCFYDKDYFHEDEIGEIAMQCFRNFHSDCKAWRYRMPGDRSRE